MNKSLRTSGKEKRQAAIREILDSTSGTTHEEILDYLAKKDVSSSQSTLSRDLREMGAVKASLGNGKSCYRLSGRVREFSRTIANYPVNYEVTGNFLVIKTMPGSAPGFCVVIDSQGWEEIVGTIAGDDTILVIARNTADIAVIIERLKGSL